MVRTVDRATLVPDESLSIDEGAVAPWNSLMWSLMTDVCRAMGVRTDVPFHELTEEEKNIVYAGPAEKKHILYKAKTPIRPASLTSPTSMRSIPSKTLWQRSRTTRG